MISAPQILEFDIALGHFDFPWPKLWHKNVVFDQTLGCSGHFVVALEKWAPVALKTFYRYVLHTTALMMLQRSLDIYLYVKYVEGVFEDAIKGPGS